MPRHMGSKPEAGKPLYRVVVQGTHPDGRESYSAYGPYQKRGVAAGQAARLGGHQRYYRNNGWITEVHLETTAVDWQREEEV
jgi:hypothetical protein